MTPFADLTNQEYRSLLTYRSRPGNATIFRPSPPLSVQDLPPAVDWREQGLVSIVKNQGNCGAGWSFSATGSMEGAYAMATGQMILFSEQELIDCVNGGK